MALACMLGEARESMVQAVPVLAILYFLFVSLKTNLSVMVEDRDCIYFFEVMEDGDAFDFRWRPAGLTCCFCTL